MAVFYGTVGNDIITAFFLSDGVAVDPPGQVYVGSGNDTILG